MSVLEIVEETSLHGPAQRPVAPIVLITGGKGGVGKTTIATNVAIELARRGRRVLLVDLDLGLSNVHVMLRMSPLFTIEDALRGRASLAECIVHGPAGLDVLPASSGTIEMGTLSMDDRRALGAALRDLAASYDLVVADSAAGIGADVLAFCQSADHVLVVTTPDPAAITDAYGLIKALHTLGEANGREIPTPELVINQVKGIEEAESTARRLRAVCERFLARSPRLAGWLPASGYVAQATALQRPLARRRGNDLLGSCFERLAARLERWAPFSESGSATSRVSPS